MIQIMSIHCKALRLELRTVSHTCVPSTSEPIRMYNGAKEGRNVALLAL